MRDLPTMIRAATLELSQARLQVFDPVATVKFLAERGINTIVCFAIGYSRGEAYYPSAYAPPHPELSNRDLFGEVVQAAERLGLATVAYVNSLFAGPEFYVPHPDWVQRWADGRESIQGEAKMLCPNSPYGDHIVRVSAEVTSRYPIAGFYLDEPSLQSWCACPYCCKRFVQDTGYELPLDLQPGTALFAKFLDWRHQVISEFVARVGAAVRAARPTITFFAQHAFPLAPTAPPHLRHLFWGKTSERTPPQWEGWYRPAFYGQHAANVAKSLDIVSCEPWRRFVGQPAWWPGVTVSYMRSASNGKRVVPLLEYPHFPWGLACLSDAELAVNCADAIANGGELWFPMYAPDAADREGWNTLSRIFAALENIRPPEAQQIAPAAILVSQLTAERFGRDAVEDRYLDDAMGAVLLARELGFPTKILTEESLTREDFDHVEILLLPSAACLTPEAADHIRAYVRGGGALVAFGWIGTHDRSGALRPEPLMTDVLGARLGPETLHAGIGYLVASQELGFSQGTRFPVRDEQPLLHLAGATVLFEVIPSWELFAPPAEGPKAPAVTLHSFGEGKVIYFGHQLGRLLRRFELFEAVNLTGELLSLARCLPVAVQGVHMSPEVSVHAWQVKNGLHVILVNFTSLEATGRVAEVSAQTIRIRSDLLGNRSKIASVQGASIAVERDGDGMLITIGGLAEWDCLVIENHP